MSYCQDAYVEALQKENAALKNRVVESSNQVIQLTLENHELRTIIDQYKEKESQAKNKIIINVTTEGIEEALEKMKELAEICEKVDMLQQQATKAQEAIIALPEGARVINMSPALGCADVNLENVRKQITEEIRNHLTLQKRAFGSLI